MLLKGFIGFGRDKDINVEIIVNKKKCVGTGILIS